MQVNLVFDGKINPILYSKYANYLYNKMQEDISYQAHKHYKNYKVRENSILSCSLIRWNNGIPPQRINLVNYFDNCLELKYEQGIYTIKLNSYNIVKGSTTLVSKLIRILEYGTLKIPAYPLVRIIFNYYSNNYKNLFINFIKENCLL